MKKTLCKYCGYIWITKSKLLYVNCPSCMKKVRTLKDELEQIKEKKEVM